MNGDLSCANEGETQQSKTTNTKHYDYHNILQTLQGTKSKRSKRKTSNKSRAKQQKLKSNGEEKPSPKTPSIMKKYKLEKWHLGLPDIEVGQEVSYTKERERNHGFIHWRVGTTTFKWSMSPEKIINNEFWSRIRPLFKTSGDGVEVYPKDKVLLIAHLKTELGDIGVSEWTAQQIVDGWNPDEVLTYYSREKAEEYRWKNSKLYSYNDIANGIELYGLDILKELSKIRTK